MGGAFWEGGVGLGNGVVDLGVEVQGKVALDCIEEGSHRYL